MNHFNFFITSDFADQISDQSFQQDKLTSVVHVANPCIRAINWVLNQQEVKKKGFSNCGFISKVYIGKTVRTGNIIRGRGTFDINKYVVIQI